MLKIGRDSLRRLASVFLFRGFLLITKSEIVALQWKKPGGSHIKQIMKVNVTSKGQIDKMCP